MAKKRSKTKNDSSVGKSIAVLFLYLCIWWVMSNIVSYTISETSGLYYLLSFLRFAVPIFVVLFGVPIILIDKMNKDMSKRKK